MDTWKCMQLFGLYMTVRVKCWLHARLELAAILFDGGGVVFDVVGHAERGHTAVKRLVYHCQGAPYLLHNSVIIRVDLPASATWQAFL